MPTVTEKKCWAECLGNCSGGLSREHIVSKAFFEDEHISVSGFDWTKDEKQSIGLSSAVSKMLCRTHNSFLSPLDSEVKTAREYFRKLSELVAKDNHTDVLSGSINGVLFERWLLKTTLNVIRSSPQKYNYFFPDYLLTQMAFGITPFNYDTKQGLYLVDPRLHNYIVEADNTITVRPLILSIEEHSCLLGSLVTFCGFSFFLNTIDPLNKDLNFKVNENINLIDQNLFHPPRIRTLKNGEFLEHQCITFTYPNISQNN